MNKFILLFLSILSISCATDNKSNKTVLAVKIDKSKTINSVTVADEPYDITFQIETTKNNDYYLTVTMALQNGSHFISPHAKRDFKGKFNISMEDNNKLTLHSDIIEIPRSVEEYDSHQFVNGNVNWVRVNTIYKQKINIKSQDDFDAIGVIVFTIEPRCTLEQIQFIFKYRSGKISVEKFIC